MTIPIDPIQLPVVVVPLPQDDLTRPLSDQKAYKVPVKRQVDIKLQCPGQTNDDDKHTFLATFDEVQRYIPCPTCSAPTEVPIQYRGQP